MRRSGRAGAACLLGALLVSASLCGAAPTEPPRSEPSGGAATRAIRFYQAQLSALRLGHCRFAPSCSQYALEAIQAYGPIVGSARAADRLMRCNRSAHFYYAASSGGRLDDPVGTESTGPLRPEVPAWLLPPPAPDPTPERSDTSEAMARKLDRLLEVKSFAASLAAGGDCERAATEYRRAAFLAGGDSWRRWARLRAGDCYFANREWSLAEKEYQAAAMLGDSAARGAACTMAAACRFDRGDPGGCEALLHRCSQNLPDQLGLLGLCRMARGSWDGAQARFAQAATAAQDSLERARFERLADWSGRGRSLPRKRPGLATASSILVPGSGQIYAGRAGDGFRHLVFNGALIWTIVSLARDHRWPAAYLVAGLELPFYLGNVMGAGRATRESNAATRLRHVARALEDAER